MDGTPVESETGGAFEDIINYLGFILFALNCHLGLQCQFTVLVEECCRDCKIEFLSVTARKKSKQSVQFNLLCETNHS